MARMYSITPPHQLQRQLPTGWAPPVVELFDALMRHKTGTDGPELYKSDIRRMFDMIDTELRKHDAEQAGAAELLGVELGDRLQFVNGADVRDVGFSATCSAIAEAPFPRILTFVR